MLDHQGMIYELVAPERRTTYPTVLISKNSDPAYSLARKVCESDAKVLVAEKVVNLDQTLKYLSGLVDERTDQLMANVNEEELKLNAAIRASLAADGLPLVTKWFWPGMAKACCVLTHDVDWLSYTPFHKAVLKAGAGPGRLLSLAVKGGIGKKNYGWNIPETVESESKRGVKSTFLLRTKYDEAQQLIKPTIDLLKKNGSEIALHATMSSYMEEDSLREELKSFKETVGNKSRL